MYRQRKSEHPCLNTPKEEAKTSLRMAAKLMTQHNIHQVEMYLEDGNMNKSQNRGDKSIVAITATKGKKAVGQGFVPNLAQAMQTFFDYHPIAPPTYRPETSTATP